MIFITITEELLSTVSSLSLGIVATILGVSVAASSVVMFSLGALTASLVCWLCNPKRSKKATCRSTANTPDRAGSKSPVEEISDSEVHTNTEQADI